MNRKGMEISLLAKFILVLLVVVILIFVFNRTMKGGTQVFNCVSNGGECKSGTCEWGKQIPLLGDKAAGCESGYICCKNIVDESTQPDPECKDKSTYRQNCGAVSSGKICNITQKCILLSDYCKDGANCNLEKKQSNNLCSQVTCVAN